MTGKLPAQTEVDAVDLTVTDLARALELYQGVLGLRVLRREGAVAHLGAERAILRLHEDPRAPQRPRGASGLYHVAYLLPDRAHLGRLIRRFIDLRHPVEGASDHFVSEALYLSDPDGNGIEVYADRPRERWTRTDGSVTMTTKPLDIESLLHAAGDEPYAGAPDGTKVGHVHLQVSDVPRAEAFYRDALGLDVTARYGPDASFLSAGGYHHHVAVNAWGSRGGPRAPDGAIGLLEYALRVPDAAALDALAERLQKAGAPVAREGADVVTSDPSGNRVRVVAAPA